MAGLAGPMPDFFGVWGVGDRMPRRLRRFLTFVAVALTVAAAITLVQSRFPAEPGAEQRALLLPSPK